MPHASSPTIVPRAETLPTDRPSPVPGRDLTVDFLRGLSILAVAIGHWLVVVTSYANGRFSGINALGDVPLMQHLTWLFQVMPLFFVVGGFANAMSWRTARRKGLGYADWLRTRLERLSRPTAILFGGWAVVGVLARLAGVDPALVHELAWLVVVPIWFLAVYVLVVALAPAMLAAHDRGRAMPLVLLGGAAVIVDVARLALGAEPLAYANFLFVFLFAQQLGFAWADGHLTLRRWYPWALAIGGVGALVVLTRVGPYPTSMVGVPGEHVANNAPPTITLIALALAQTGLGLLARRRIERWLTRRTVAGATLALNLNAMTILLWHFTALVIVSLVVLPLGLVPDLPAGTGGWWAVRVSLLAGYGVVLAGIVRVVGRVERPRAGMAVPVTAATPGGGGSWATAEVLAATILFAASCSMITLGGLSDAATRTGIPVAPLGCFATACWLVMRRHHTVSTDQSSKPKIFSKSSSCS